MTSAPPTLIEPSLELMKRALAASRCGISIADARLPDQPLIYVNPAFEEMTGYSSHEVLGKNCRFLQGGDSTQAGVVQLREAITEARDSTVILKNYRKDGTPFWNELVISPVRDAHGEVTHFIGVQTDITNRRKVENALHHANEALEQKVDRRTSELRATYDATLEGWGKALEMRDQESEGHSQRVTTMTVRLGRSMGISEDELVHIRRGALLHDIGKIGVPDRILLKPGKLTPEEFEILKQHPVLAYEWLRPVKYLERALAIPYSHHEKWDGTGYPLGLKGDEIPFAARIFAVVDVWDALRCDRHYRKAWPEAKVIQFIEDGANTHFDPAVVAAFVSLLKSHPADIPKPYHDADEAA